MSDILSIFWKNLNGINMKKKIHHFFSLSSSFVFLLLFFCLFFTILRLFIFLLFFFSFISFGSSFSLSCLSYYRKINQIESQVEIRCNESETSCSLSQYNTQLCCQFPYSFSLNLFLFPSFFSPLSFFRFILFLFSVSLFFFSSFLQRNQ